MCLVIIVTISEVRILQVPETISRFSGAIGALPGRRSVETATR
jgi:hypothetical protein